MKAKKILTKKCCAEIAALIDAYIKKSQSEDAEKLIAELERMGYADAKGTVKQAEILERAISNVLKEQGKSFAESVKNAGDLITFLNETVPELKVNDKTAEKLRQIFGKEFNGYVPKLTQTYVSGFDDELTVKQITRRTQSFLAGWSKELGKRMKEAAYEELTRILSNAIEKGKGVRQAAKDIMDSVLGMPYSRARRVALTEMLRAHSYAQQEAMVQTPSITHKIWRHTGFGMKPRENHADMNGQKVKTDEAFVLTGKDGNIYHPMIPRDTELPAGESINCHCFVQPIADEGILGYSLEERQKMQAAAITEDDGKWEKELDEKAHREADEWRAKPLNYRKAIDLFIEEENLDNSEITAESILADLQTSEMGRDTIEYIEKNDVLIKILYEKRWDYVRGEQIGNIINIYAPNNETVKQAAQTVVHEVGHIIIGEDQTQHAEAYCFGRELLHIRNQKELSQEDKKHIVRLARKHYPEDPWRRK